MCFLGTLATEIRDRLGPPPDLTEYPLVSIVVLNRNGAGHLRRLLAGLIEHTDYPHLELILVDNDSSDDSLELIRSVQAAFPISILANPHNESFSDANNQGAELASGELLLFLNNDIEPFEPGWLRELVACHRNSGAGAVGATLIYPDETDGSSPGYRVQSQQLRLRERSGMLTIEGTERELFGEGFGEDIESVIVLGACFLIEPELFWRVGGFTHGFFYGGEDDDLSLKLREGGHRTLYSGRSVLIHHFNSTSRELLGDAGGPIRRGNRHLLLQRWGPRAWRECALGRLAGGNVWAVPDPEAPSAVSSLEQAMALGFCLRADDSTVEKAAALEAELARRGHRCLALGDDSLADPRGYLYDVAVHLRGHSRDVPASGQLNVLWAMNNLDALGRAECRRYDLVVTGSDEHALIGRVLERAEEIGLKTRIEPSEGGDPPQEPPSIVDPDTEVFHAMASESEGVVVAFTAKEGGRGSFQFFKLLEPLPFSKLLVRDPSGTWYNTGLPGVGDTVEEIAAAIEQEISKLGATRIVTLGSSMGAYAAILFGCMLGAERAIALAPQTLLDPSLQPRLLPADISLQVPDLRPVIRDAPGTKVDLVAGWDENVDIFHSQRVADLASVRVLALPGRRHWLARELHSQGELLPLIVELIDGGTPKACLVEPPLEPATAQRIAEATLASKQDEWEVVAERLGTASVRP